MKTNKTESYFKFSSFGFTNFANKSLIYVRESIFNKFLEVSNINSTDLVLDVGVSAQDHQSSNFFEQYYPFKKNLTALGLGEFQELESLYPGIHYVKGNGEKLPFKNRQFDWTFSHAVIEHVGNNENRVNFLKELIRVSKKGVFLTTPNRLHPLEFHTGLPIIHYLPKCIHRFIYKILGKEFYSKEENLNLFFPFELRQITETAIKELNLQKSTHFKLTYIYWLKLPSNILAVLKFDK